MDRAIEREKRSRAWVIAMPAGIVAAVLLVVSMSWNASAPASEYVVSSGNKYPEVQGRAVLEPVQVTAISVQSDGVVTSIPVAVGATVARGTILAVTTNPTLAAELRQARLAFNNAEAAARISQADLDEALLDREIEASRMLSELHTARAELQAYERLYEKGGISRLALEKVRAATSQAETEHGFSKRKLEQFRTTIRSHEVAVRSNVDIAREHLSEATRNHQALTLVAPQPGVVSRLDLTPGQRLSPGAEVGQIMSKELKADIGIPQDEASALEVGQEVSFRAPQGTFTGRIVSIMPRAIDGVVHTKAMLDQAPPWLRPDLVCEAAVKGKQAVDGLFVRVPVGAVANTTVEVRVRDKDGGEDARRVVFGNRFGDTLQVVSGLETGDRILSVTQD